MKNNKGMTMIELLGVITLLGIILVVAVPNVYKYATGARNQSYDTMVPPEEHFRPRHLAGNQPGSEGIHCEPQLRFHPGGASDSSFHPEPRGRRDCRRAPARYPHGLLHDKHRRRKRQAQFQVREDTKLVVCDV